MSLRENIVRKEKNKVKQTRAKMGNEMGLKSVKPLKWWNQTMPLLGIQILFWLVRWQTCIAYWLRLLFTNFVSFYKLLKTTGNEFVSDEYELNAMFLTMRQTYFYCCIFLFLISFPFFTKWKLAYDTSNITKCNIWTVRFLLIHSIWPFFSPTIAKSITIMHLCQK